MNARDPATQRQVEASRPHVSTWLAANAGSGKTRVLTDRVARLLLAGVPPQRILCMTYTKAAASEMQNRLFARLGRWAMMADADLRQELGKLDTQDPLTQEVLAQARTLFARAIETPGGLKIQTIHSFCAALLRRFPLEAGVSPQFVEMEQRTATALHAEVMNTLADGPDAALIEELAGSVSGIGFEALTDEIAKHRARFSQPRTLGDILAGLEQPRDLNETAVVGTVFLGGEQRLLQALLTALQAGSSTDQKNAARLAALPGLGWEALAPLEAIFLLKSGDAAFTANIARFPTKGTQTALGALLPELHAWMHRVEAARQPRLALLAARKTHLLERFAQVFLPAYAAVKQARGWLDFDDLILKSQALLKDPGLAQWVLYRLDGGIDHILVDEAQDTSPAQWEVVERLAQEFTSGQGAREDTQRTIFVVGDKKQSIYSFQGADPREFDRMRDHFDTRLSQIGAPFFPSSLEHSFRSAPPILRLVDRVFEGLEGAGFPQDNVHRAFHGQMPGRVDLWPVVEPAPAPQDVPWYEPLDRQSDTHHLVVLARKVADQIAEMLETATLPVADGTGGYAQRPVRPGDFLILVQRRKELFAEIIRACKARNLPIAGADVLKVGAEIAVKDLAALLAFLATPEDDLALATVLKSPLCGWSEQALFDLAHRRETPRLWPALRQKAQEHPQTLAYLNDLLARADFLRPYDLLERALTRHDGRARLLARLGPEATDGIDALLSQALAYERGAVPSLTGFLAWMERDELEIKRQVDAGGDVIRVMTVHGAKGLEAPIVILPDTGPRSKGSPATLALLQDALYWHMPAGAAPAALEAAEAQRGAAQEAERLRLLYVAMTRAENWLIVAAAGEMKDNGDSWYQRIEAAMEAEGPRPERFGSDDGLRLEEGDWSGGKQAPASNDDIETPDLPTYLRTPFEPSAPDLAALRPSDLGGAKALPGDLGQDEETALRKGRQLHLLLEHLPATPREQWPERAAALLAAGADAAEGPLLDALLQEAIGVLEDPALRVLFSNDALAEVPISARLGARRIHGQIDRLIVNPDHVLAVDFKTHATVPATPQDCPEALLRQMGAYAEGLAQIYPGRTIQTALLWTGPAKLMHLPHDIVSQALARSPYLDAAEQGS